MGPVHGGQNPINAVCARCGKMMYHLGDRKLLCGLCGGSQGIVVQSKEKGKLGRKDDGHGLSDSRTRV
jgi:hypothetical protein